MTSARPVNPSIRLSTPFCVVAFATSTPKKIATPRMMPVPVRAERPFLCAKLLEPSEDSLRTSFTAFRAVVFAPAWRAVVFAPAWRAVGRRAARSSAAAFREVDAAANPAVLEVDHFVAVRGGARVVCDDHDGLPVLGLQVLQQPQDLAARPCVEVARRLAG